MNRTKSLFLALACSGFLLATHPGQPGFNSYQGQPGVKDAVKNTQGCWESEIDVGGVKSPLVMIPSPRLLGLSQAIPNGAWKDINSLWLGKFPMTQEIWSAVMGSNPSIFKSVGPNAPVERVGWNEVQKFIQKLNSMQGRWRFRLPTAIELEWAITGGSTIPPMVGLGEKAWYEENSEEKTHPVGLKQPNGFGLYDTLGNVLQWTEDSWSVSASKGDLVTDPKNSLGKSYKVAVGVAWSMTGNGPNYMRQNLSPNTSWDYVGFRLAADLINPNVSGDIRP